MFSIRKLRSITCEVPLGARTPPRQMGMLPGSDRRKFRRHLETCEAECRQAPPSPATRLAAQDHLIQTARE